MNINTNSNLVRFSGLVLLAIGISGVGAVMAVELNPFVMWIAIMTFALLGALPATIFAIQIGQIVYKTFTSLASEI